MEESQNFHIENAPDFGKVMIMLSKLNPKYDRDIRLKIIQELSQFRFDYCQTFEALKQIIISEMSEEIRYHLIKILYNNFPEKSLPFLKQVLMTDYNYNFRIIDFSEDKRYNMNDVLNFIINKKYHRKQMLSDIINNNLIRFAISWKEYAKYFNVFYDLSLKSFVLFSKEIDFFLYFCSRANDPFDFGPNQKIISFSKVKFLNKIQRKKFRVVLIFLKEFLNIQERDLNLVVIQKKNDEILPKFKVFSDNHEFFVYFGTEIEAKNDDKDKL